MADQDAASGAMYVENSKLNGLHVSERKAELGFADIMPQRLCFSVLSQFISLLLLY